MNSCKIPQIGYLMIGIRRVFLHCHTIRNTFSQKYKGSRSPLPVATNSAKRVHLLQVLQPQQVRQVRQVQQTASRARCKKPTSGSVGNGVAVRELGWYTVEVKEGERRWHSPRKNPCEP